VEKWRFAFDNNEANFLTTHMRSDPNHEQMGFALGVHERTANGTVFLVNEVILPGSDDLGEQSAGGVSPTHDFQSYVYFRSEQTGQDIIEFHTHPGSHTPHFSSIDEHHGHSNAACISRRLPDPVTLLMVVGNNRFDAFDSVVWDRAIGRFRSVERLEFVGKPLETFWIGARDERPDHAMVDAFDRQMRIPGWNQQELARQRIGIVGVGGNGAHVFQTLVGMGAGSNGAVTIVDHDKIENSNLPRIPYATAEQVGMLKVTAATQWAGRKAPKTSVIPVPCSVDDATSLHQLATCTVLFGCVDNDGGRMVTNELAVRFGIPLIDLGCDIQVRDDEVISGGQVRVVLPGQNACLVCCRGFDPSEAAMDLMSDADKALRAERGYVRDSEADATPSVANLNAMTAQLGVAQFLALTHGRQFWRLGLCPLQPVDVGRHRREFQKKG
jgi:molybdopterin/thiamine biosynthesis adenylyltransferase